MKTEVTRTECRVESKSTQSYLLELFLFKKYHVFATRINADNKIKVRSIRVNQRPISETNLFRDNSINNNTRPQGYRQHHTSNHNPQRCSKQTVQIQKRNYRFHYQVDW